MNDTIDPTNALELVTGGPIYDRNWRGNTTGKYIIGFAYDKTSGTATTMKAEADNCKNKDPDGGRKLDGNRVQPSADDKEWSY